MQPALVDLLRDGRAVLDAQDWQPHAHVLLADFLACATAAVLPSAGWDEDGVAGTAAVLSMRAHSGDRDDVDWPTLTHPGSIVWATTLALASHGRDADPQRLLRAAATGYQASADIAALLGAGAARRWHLTAVAGHAGAAVAASGVMGLDESETADALGLALCVAGGLARSSSERSTAMRWHRAAAAVAGLQAARAARDGVRAPADLLYGSGGVLDAFGCGEPVEASTQRETPAAPAIMRASVRLYPTCGLNQAAVRAAATARRRLARLPTSARVGVSPQVEAATRSGGPGGAWWTLRTAAAMALTTGDEWSVGAEPDESARTLAERLEIRPDQRTLLAVEVAVPGLEPVRIAEPPGNDPVTELADVRQKWEHMALPVGRPEQLAATVARGEAAQVVRTLLGGAR